jgi:hypothetical protein
MNLVGNIAPLVVGLLFGVIAYVSVRRAHRQATDSGREADAAAE